MEPSGRAPLGSFPSRQWSVETMRRFDRLLPFALFLLSACPRHYGTQSTRSGNDIVLTDEGIPAFPGSVQRCPSPNGEGKVELSYEGGKKRVRGECHGGVMVGDWKAWYENGAVVWKASFEHGRLEGKF